MASVSKMLLLLLCSYYSLSVVAHAVEYSVLATASLEPEGVCSSEPLVTPSSSIQSTVALNYRYGPCSPVPSANKATFEELLDDDNLQADYIQRKFQKKSGAGGAQKLEVTVPTTMASGTAAYIINVGIGSPAVNQTLLIDTASDMSWVHCQSGSSFDPSKSSTYAPFPCNSTACAQLTAADYGNGCSNSQCQYTVSYADGSKSTGTYASDTLELTGSVEVKNFQFGCNRVDQGAVNETIDGVMALGGDTESLVSQTAAIYGKTFSYCLPRPSRSGFFTLGAPSNASGFVTTPMISRTESPTFYRVLLQGIAVGGKLLDIPTSVFSGGSVMSTGTSITRLPPTAYTALKTAFRDGMKQFPLAEPRGYLDTCFNFTGRTTNISIPSVALVFSGDAVVKVSPNGVLFGSCLGFTASSGIGIIGNVQQRTLEVMYDVGQSVVGFRPGAC